MYVYVCFSYTFVTPCALMASASLPFIVLRAMLHYIQTFYGVSLLFVLLNLIFITPTQTPFPLFIYRRNDNKTET